MSRFLPVSHDETIRLCREIIQSQKKRTFHCQISNCINITKDDRIHGNVDLIDIYAVEHGLFPLNAQWIEITESSAVEIMTRLLHKDLAYGIEIMPEAQAERLAARFVAVVQRGEVEGQCSYFTNGSVGEPVVCDIQTNEVLGWIPASDATFDTGVILMNRQFIGLIWAEDED